MRRRTAWAAAAALLVAACGPCAAQASAGDLLLVPGRVVFEGTTRNAQITLMNIGQKPATYRISFVNRRMTGDGKFEDIAKPAPGEQFADKLVRVVPQQVILEPRVSQVVRLQLRLPAELPNGEYRSHLMFRAVPTDAPAAPAVPGQAPAGISVKLTAIYGLSIPVIVRRGETRATVTISDLRLTPGAAPTDPPVLTGRLNRTGNRSVYGDLSVEFAPGSGKRKRVADMNGVAVYTPNGFRLIGLPLVSQDGAAIQGGKLIITYRQRPDEGGAVIAQASVDAP